MLSFQDLLHQILNNHWERQVIVHEYPCITRTSVWFLLESIRRVRHHSGVMVNRWSSAWWSFSALWGYLGCQLLSLWWLLFWNSVLHKVRLDKKILCLKAVHAVFQNWMHDVVFFVQFVWNVPILNHILTYDHSKPCWTMYLTYMTVFISF